MATPSMRPWPDGPRSETPCPRRRVERLLTEDQAADILRVSPRTLQGWRQRGDGPPWVKLGATVRYRRRDLRRYIIDSVRGRRRRG